jgi:hypothetical protein
MLATLTGFGQRKTAKLTFPTSCYESDAPPGSARESSALHPKSHELPTDILLRDASAAEAAISPLQVIGRQPPISPGRLESFRSRQGAAQRARIASHGSFLPIAARKNGGHAQPIAKPKP